MTKEHAIATSGTHLTVRGSAGVLRAIHKNDLGKSSGIPNPNPNPNRNSDSSANARPQPKKIPGVPSIYTARYTCYDMMCYG